MTEHVINVLLIEDNPADARMVHESLNETGVRGFIIKTEQSLGGAIRSLAKGGFDVMIVDLSLPDGEGIATIQRLQGVAPMLPIVVLTGIRSEHRAEQAVNIGVQDFLVKGEFDGTLLARVIRYAIERKRNADRLSYLAQYDQLTGLPNRLLFRDRLDLAIRRASRNEKVPGLVLMFLDLDGFKGVNDTMGHDVGDGLLRLVAERLTGCVRECDTVARLGGDEFTIILENVTDGAAVSTVARKIVEAMKYAFAVAGRDIHVTPSIGIARYPNDGEQVDELLKSADTAMYKAKGRGRNNFQYASDHGSHAEGSGRNPLKKSAGEYLFAYEPVVDLGSRQVIGAEAVLCRRHSHSGKTAPFNSRVMPMGEAEFNTPVYNQMLRQTCRDLSAWKGKVAESFTVSVPLAVGRFRDEEYIGSILETIHSHGLEPRQFEFELSEMSLLESVSGVVKSAKELHQAGCSVSLGRFGEQGVPLALLQRLPLDVLKVDQSIMFSAANRIKASSMSPAIQGLGHCLGVDLMVKGVCMKEQLATLMQHGISLAQGNLFGRPMECETLSDLMQQGGSIDLLPPYKELSLGEQARPHYFCFA